MSTYSVVVTSSEVSLRNIKTGIHRKSSLDAVPEDFLERLLGPRTKKVACLAMPLTIPCTSPWMDVVLDMEVACSEGQ